MQYDNDNSGADRVIEIRPSPDELNRILHRRFPGMGPAFGRQLDEAARLTFNADATRWLGLDGRWHSTMEKYRQGKGKRRQPKANAVSTSERDKPLTEPMRDGWYFSETESCRWRQYAPAVAVDALELQGKIVSATGGVRLLQINAVEDAIIRAIDAKRALAANDNIPEGHRRNRPRRRAA